MPNTNHKLKLVKPARPRVICSAQIKRGTRFVPSQTRFMRYKKHTMLFKCDWYKLKKALFAFVAAVLAVCLLGCAAMEPEQPAPSETVVTSQEQPAPTVLRETAQPPARKTAAPEPEEVVLSDYAIERPRRLNAVPMGEPDTWTVFIYMCGTDLESEEQRATDNLNELFGVNLSENVNIIIQTGGTKEWHTDGIKADKLQRFRVQDGGLSLLSELPRASMGEAETLASFLSWGVREYPAEKMALLFWNHGGGSMVGTQYDQHYGRDALTLPELDQALTAIYPAMTDQFELIGFDTCLMATLEVANILATHARYMVASEEVEPSGGWDYRLSMQYLSDTPRATGGDLGAVICDAYYAKCKNTDMGGWVTQSLIDLSAIDTVLLAFNNVARSLHQTIDDPQAFAQAVRGAGKAESYGGGSAREGYTNLVDMGDLVRKMKALIPEQADTLEKTLSRAVVYDVAGESRNGASGLSVFYPLTARREDIALYEEIAPTPGYLAYVRDLIESKVDLLESGEGLVQIAREPAVSADSHYEMQIAPQSLDIVQSVSSALYYDAGDALYSLGFGRDVTVDFESGTVRDNFAGTWATLLGQPFLLFPLEQTEGYSLYTTPVLLNGEPTNLRISYTPSASGGAYEMIGVWAGIDADTGMSAREIKKPQPGDTLIPLFRAVDRDTGEESESVEGTPIVVTEGMEFTQGALPEGEYLYGFMIEDVYGGQYETERAVFTVDGAGGLWIG
ncbi:MAG TPA: hypothetical protein DEB31_11815 [Clostridiales bacterium]|nr:hypothetical protein [Clostridiales bacterium]